MTKDQAIDEIKRYIYECDDNALSVEVGEMAISALEESTREYIPISHFKECYHCGHKSVYWQNDYDFEDFGYEGQGIVQTYTCANCGTEIECSIPITNSEGEE